MFLGFEKQKLGVTHGQKKYLNLHRKNVIPSVGEKIANIILLIISLS